MTARIAEIFESIQGEGLYLGEKQVFVRFFGCSLGCAFCDTPLTHFKEYSVEELRVAVLSFRDYHSLCLTGGEPLEQVEFLKDFLGNIQDLKIKAYLETNGIMADAWLKVRDLVDIVAMDFKLPSSCRCVPFWREHESFLKASLGKDVFIKMVISHATLDEDIFTARDIVKKTKPDVPVVLQPNWFDADSILLDKIVSFKREFTEAGISDVRILPQAHKAAGIR